MRRTDERAEVEASCAAEEVGLESKRVGALPLINHFLKRAGVDEALERFLAEPGSRDRVPLAVVLGVLLRNLRVCREPLYHLRDWCRRTEEALLGLPVGGAEWLNDDRLGRALDHLFEADRAALMTAVVAQTARAFELNLEQLHNDSTTVTFRGQYAPPRGLRRNARTPIASRMATTRTTDPT
jgi:hypothetical protein